VGVNGACGDLERLRRGAQGVAMAWAWPHWLRLYQFITLNLLELRAWAGVVRGHNNGGD